jgi:hypothetical protein
MTGYHRKYAIAVLGAEPGPPRKRRRKRRYGPVTRHHIGPAPGPLSNKQVSIRRAAHGAGKILNGATIP